MDLQQTAAAESNRRTFLRHGTLLLLGAGLDGMSLATVWANAEASRPKVRIGLATDLHYADKEPGGNRFYRESLTKLAEAGERFRTDQPDFVVELGDFIDSAESVEGERGFLKRIHEAFSALPGRKHYVLGNHCVYSLTKQEFLDIVGQRDAYYSFDVGGYHFVVLDACFRSDGTPYGRKNFTWTDANLPAAELAWLRSDLEATTTKAVVFLHQRLDFGEPYGVKNAAEVRKLLEESGKVLAVFQGHYHRNDYRQIAGLHYCTLVAMVDGSGAENNGYATVDLLDQGAIRVTGFRKQKSYPATKTTSTARSCRCWQTGGVKVV